MTNGKLTLEQLYRQGRKTLAQSPSIGEDAGFEALLLFQKVFHLSREELLLQGNHLPSPAQEQEYAALLEKKLAGEPLQYLLGEWEFFGYPFAVGPGVLIPRPETELLVELVLEHLSGTTAPKVLDLCSGTGCIPITIAMEHPDTVCVGVELSEEALPYFRRNLELNHCDRVTIIPGDVLHLPAHPELTGPFHVVISNPPYIARKELPQLQKEVLREPQMALDGGDDGLLFYRRLPEIAFSLLAPGGLLAMEIGEDQGDAVAALTRQAGFQQVKVHQDPAGHDRVVTGLFLV